MSTNIPMTAQVDHYGLPTLAALGVTVSIAPSPGTDGAVVIHIDTEFEPDGSDNVGLRVHINDTDTYVGVPYGHTHDYITVDDSYPTAYRPATPSGHVDQCRTCQDYRTVEDPAELLAQVVTELDSRSTGLDYYIATPDDGDELVVTGPNGHCAIYDPSNWSEMAVGTSKPTTATIIEPTGLPDTAVPVSQIVDTIAYIAWREPVTG